VPFNIEIVEETYISAFFGRQLCQLEVEFALGLGELLRASLNTLKLARKSSKDEFLLYLKLVTLGVIAVGVIGFIIQFVSSLIKLDKCEVIG